MHYFLNLVSSLVPNKLLIVLNFYNSYQSFNMAIVAPRQAPDYDPAFSDKCKFTLENNRIKMNQFQINSL